MSKHTVGLVVPAPGTEASVDLDAICAAARESNKATAPRPGYRMVQVSEETMASLRLAFQVPVCDDMTGRWSDAVRRLWEDLAGEFEETA